MDCNGNENDETVDIANNKEVKSTLLGRTNKDYLHYVIEYNSGATSNANFLFYFFPFYFNGSFFTSPENVVYMNKASDYKDALLVNKDLLNEPEYKDLYDFIGCSPTHIVRRKNIESCTALNGISYTSKNDNNKALNASFNSVGLYSINPTISSKYQIKISGNSYCRLKMLIWDEDTYQLISYSNHWLTNQTTQIDLVAGKKYLIEVMVDIKEDAYKNENKFDMAANREEMQNISFSLKNLKPASPKPSC